jgi:inhibitor of cysteine peptidase
MKSKLILLGVVVAVLLSLVACTSATKQAEVSVDIDDFMEQKHISKEVEVAVDGSLTVTLGSNQTTGFKWELAEITGESVLEYVDDEYVPPEDTGVVGAGGKEIWTFKALKKGTTEVSMEYSQPWEGGEKTEWTFALTVVVK